MTGAISSLGLAAGLATGGIGEFFITTVISFGAGVVGNALSQLISFGDVYWSVSLLNGGINALTTGVMHIGLMFADILFEVTWVQKFLEAAGISEVAVGLSTFFATIPNINPNDLRGTPSFDW